MRTSTSSSRGCGSGTSSYRSASGGPVSRIMMAFTAGNDTTSAESPRVADLPQFLTLKHNRDRSERVELVIRRATFAVITLIALLALLNFFGQRPRPTTVSADAAELEVFAPKALRGGLYYEGRLTVEPKRDIDKATLVLDSGWTEQM